MSPARVALDTNCLVSALIFSRGRCAWLREAWQAKRFIALASQETVEELLRVLNYPKFKLSRDEQEMLLGDYLPYANTIRIEQTPEGLPDIRDADDLMFFALAILGRADVLVSGDGDLQAAKSQFRIPILSLAEFADWLERRDGSSREATARAGPARPAAHQRGARRQGREKNGSARIARSRQRSAERSDRARAARFDAVRCGAVTILLAVQFPEIQHAALPRQTPHRRPR